MAYSRHSPSPYSGGTTFVHYRSSKTSKTAAASGSCRGGRSAGREACGEGESWMERSGDGGAAVEAVREEGVAAGPAAVRGASAAVATKPSRGSEAGGGWCERGVASGSRRVGDGGEIPYIEGVERGV
jgi:hypothetical protein